MALWAKPLEERHTFVDFLICPNDHFPRFPDNITSSLTSSCPYLTPAAVLPCHGAGDLIFPWFCPSALGDTTLDSHGLAALASMLDAVLSQLTLFPGAAQGPRGNGGPALISHFHSV